MAAEALPTNRRLEIIEKFAATASDKDETFMQLLWDIQRCRPTSQKAQLGWILKKITVSTEYVDVANTFSPVSTALHPQANGHTERLRSIAFD